MVITPACDKLIVPAVDKATTWVLRPPTVIVPAVVDPAASIVETTPSVESIVVEIDMFKSSYTFSLGL